MMRNSVICYNELFISSFLTRWPDATRVFVGIGFLGGLALPVSASSMPQPVWDTPEPFLAFMLGAVDSDWEGRVTGKQVREAIHRLERRSSLPINGLLALSRRSRETQSQAQWIITFDGKQHLPVPYSLLGYRPGHIKVSEALVLDEWTLGDFVFPWGPKNKPIQVVLRDVTLWAINPGTLFMDIDGWLDLLLGKTVDDTHIVGLALFRYEGERYAVALGYNREGEGASGMIHLRKNMLMFPYPGRFQHAAQLLRARLERLAPQAVGPYRRLSPRKPR